MTSGRTVKFYIDYKSPYAYLAKDPAYRLAEEAGAEIDWLPYILDIPAYLGSAKVDAQGGVLEQNRNAHQWRRVKYSYMDVRREANRVGLTIRGTQKIWDSSLAGIGLLYAKAQGVMRAYNDEVFERFWKRELDIVGVGYRAEMKGQQVHLALGYSHPVVFDIPKGIDVVIDKQTHITVTGVDRQLVGQVAANLRRLREPDPYQQKGVRYTGEVLKKKAGKTGA